MDMLPEPNKTLQKIFSFEHKIHKSVSKKVALSSIGNFPVHHSLHGVLALELCNAKAGRNLYKCPLYVYQCTKTKFYAFNIHFDILKRFIPFPVKRETNVFHFLCVSPHGLIQSKSLSDRAVLFIVLNITLSDQQ